METCLQLIKRLNDETGGFRGNILGMDGYYGIEKEKGGKYHIVHVREYGQDRKRCVYYLTWEQLPFVLQTIIDWEEAQ